MGRGPMVYVILYEILEHKVEEGGWDTILPGRRKIKKKKWPQQQSPIRPSLQA